MQGNIIAGYRDIFLAGGEGAFRRILRHVLERPGEVFLVHCTARKDRTGVIVVVMLALAGVEDEIVAEESELTRVAMQSMLQKLKAKVNALPLLQSMDEKVREEGRGICLGVNRRV